MFTFIFIGLVALFLLILFSQSVFIIHQQKVGILERFGRFKRVTPAGLRILIPFVDKMVGLVNLRIQQLDVHVETKTKDNVFVNILVSVQYHVVSEKVFEAYYKLENANQQIQAFVFDVVRAKVHHIDLDDVFCKKDEIAIDVKQELHDIMSGLGYEILKTLVTDIQPDPNVKNAMNEINTAQRLRVAAQEKAEAEKIMRVKQAEGEAEASILHGKGVAGQRQAIIEGLGQSVEDMQKTSPKLKSSEIMEMVLMIQYFDMLREVGGTSKTNTIFMDHSPSSIKDIGQHLRETIFAAKANESK
ncbi:SPFH domain-containing protein [Alphaproteobacteria bacterium]|nr:SPFH domain-containing protein [Alphaproteobacteria bacterium]